MPNDAYDEVQKVYPQAHQTAAGIYDRDPTNQLESPTVHRVGQDREKEGEVDGHDTGTTDSF